MVLNPGDRVRPGSQIVKNYDRDNTYIGRHLIDRISDWPNPHGLTKGVRFVCLNRYVQVDQKPFGQSEIRSIRNSVNPKFGQYGSYDIYYIIYFLFSPNKCLHHITCPNLKYLVQFVQKLLVKTFFSRTYRGLVILLMKIPP